ncbi:MAG: hypothetical protein ACR2QK_18575 [Acidimicrobiales bacterium]
MLRRWRSRQPQDDEVVAIATEELGGWLDDAIRPHVLGPGSDVAAGLEAWDWIDLTGKEQLFCSLFGHVFLEGDAGVWLLDPIDGSFERRWADRAELVDDLRLEASQDEYLLAGIAIGAANRGPQLGDRQIWAFTPPPITGGTFAVENLMAMDLEVGLHLAGQIHSQVRDLPPGTPISGFAIEDADQ